jgi:hypothetical protein
MNYTKEQLDKNRRVIATRSVSANMPAYHTYFGSIGELVDEVTKRLKLAENTVSSNQKKLKPVKIDRVRVNGGLAIYVETLEPDESVIKRLNEEMRKKLLEDEKKLVAKRKKEETAKKRLLIQLEKFKDDPDVIKVIQGG